MRSRASQRAELVADPSLLPNAVEELLRYEAPSPAQGRMTTRDVELHGEIVPKDSKVLLLTGAAGRDERKYGEDADRFDIHRRFDNHVSFGYGIHFCIGAALARMEGRIALEEALKRFPEWKVDHEAAVRHHTSTVRGWIHVPDSVYPSSTNWLTTAEPRRTVLVFNQLVEDEEVTTWRRPTSCPGRSRPWPIPPGATWWPG